MASSTVPQIGYVPYNNPVWGDPKQAKDIASQMLNTVTGYVNTLNNLAGNLFPPQITPSFPTINALPAQLTATAPTLATVAWNVPAQPAAFTGSLNVSPYLPGQFQGTPPTLNFGSAPAPFSGTVPAAPSLDFNFTYPNTAVALPNAPPLLSLNPVVFSPLALPTFTGTTPQMTLSTPSILPYVEGSGFTSSLLTTIENDLAAVYADDSYTGLTAGTQKAMWDAAREREYRQQADALAALDRDMEALGYQLPHGVYTDARFKIYTETTYSIQGLSRDIMVKQAEMRLENVVKARELAVQLESTLIGYANNQAQRAFEAAKYATEAQIEIYNAQVKIYEVQIEAYKAQIEAYNAQLHQIEIYVEQLKAQIAFEQTKAEINTAIVNQYKTEVDAALAVIQVYDLQVKIIQTQADIQKTKVEAYGSQIQAFVGTVNAYTAQIEAYKANIEAQGAIEGVYKTQVDVYAAEVQAGVGIADALVRQYEGQIKAYEAQLEGYKANLQAMVEQARAAQEYNTSAVEAFKGNVASVTAYNQVLTSQWEAVINEQEKITEVAVKAAEANGQLYIAAKQLSIDAAKTGAQTAAQLGAAALNAISFHNTSSWSLGTTYTNSQQNSSSVVDEYITSYSKSV